MSTRTREEVVNEQMDTIDWFDRNMADIRAAMERAFDAADERDRLRAHFNSCGDCLDCLGESDPKTALDIALRGKETP